MSTLFLVFFLQLPGACSSGGAKINKEVQKAFQLRMEGRADEARTLLESILKKDSTNAMAHYEMARLKQYMIVWNANTTLDEILREANKAEALDPDNVVYSYYLAMTKFLNAFMAMQMQKGDVKNHVTQTCDQFEKVLALKPDYSEAMLYLVEIYGMLPPEMGGDSLKAAEYADQLAGKDNYYGAMAKAALAGENTDFVEYWESQLAGDQKNPNLLSEVGKAYLYKEEVANAEKYFDEAMKADPSKNILLLDLARYHMYAVMQNRDKASTELPIAKTWAEKFLHSTPEPIVPLKAYATGLISIFERFMGHKEEAEKKEAEANSLDPYYSKATGLPSQVLFESPEKECHHFTSFFRPF